MPERDHGRQFLVFVFILLLPCFALWTVAAAPLALPALGFANSVLSAWFPGVVDTLYADGQHALLMTRFGELNGRPTALAGAEYQLGFQLDTRILSYSLPFYTAMHFATPRRRYFNTWVMGLLVLYPLFALGLVCLGMKELMAGLGELFYRQPTWVPGPNLIGICYQTSVLIVPTLAPVMIWLWQSRNTPLLLKVLGSLQKTAAKSGG
ncbi:MAG: hypothetical protein CME59_08450 [Halioglobus sp.]|nr:hypothetical protein [Halioglobus sp.]